MLQYLPDKIIEKISKGGFTSQRGERVIGECEIKAILKQSTVEPKEPKAIPFKGFCEEKMALKITDDASHIIKHNHLEIWHGEEYIGYMHIDTKDIFFWCKKKGCGGDHRIHYADFKVKT